MEIEKNNFDDVIEFYKAEETQSLLDRFLNQVEHFFRTNPTLKKAKTIHYTIWQLYILYRKLRISERDKKGRICGKCGKYNRK